MDKLGENIKDILDNIKDRFSSPLMFSFVLTWLIINWQITVALLWYDISQIKNEGYDSVYDFIKSKLSIENSLCWPMVFALMYTFGNPIIRNVISAFYSWTEKWGENWKLRITKEMKIPFEKHLRLQMDFEKRSKILEEAINKESETLEAYNRTRTDFLESQMKINDLQLELASNKEFLSKMYDKHQLNGYWICTYKSDTESFEGEEEIEIRDGKYYIFEKLGRVRYAFIIRDFFLDSKKNTVFFVKEMTEEEEEYRGTKGIIAKHLINQLSIERGDHLLGFENWSIRIEYRRRK